jgi:hypothetical protein
MEILSHGYYRRKPATPETPNRFNTEFVVRGSLSFGDMQFT